MDLLWFQSLGYGGVFWRTFFLETGVFVVSCAVTFALLYGAFRAMQRFHQADLPSAHAIVIAGQPVMLSVAPALRVISLLVSLAVALIAGLAMTDEWATLALFRYAPHTSGSALDPIFGKPLEFYLFTLPAWQVLNNWLLTLAIATCAVAVLFLVITSGSRSIENRRLQFAPAPWLGLSLTSAFLLLVMAMTVYVSRFGLLLDHHTLFDGINYTDAHVTVHGLTIVAIALAIGAAIAIANAVRGARGLGIVAAVRDFVVFGTQIGAVFNAIRTPAGGGRTLNLIGIAFRHDATVGDQHQFCLR